VGAARQGEVSWNRGFPEYRPAASGGLEFPEIGVR